MKIQFIPLRIIQLSMVLLLGSLVLITGCSEGEDPDDPSFSCTDADGILCDVAGIAGEQGGSGNGGDALEAFLYWPMDMTHDEEGRLLIVDFNNHCVRRVDKDNVIERVIGSGLLGDRPFGVADEINLNHPTSITVGPAGDLWLAAWHNWKLEKITVATWSATLIAGNSLGFSGDGGPAGLAQLGLPSSVVFDADGNIYISDQGNQRIRKIDTDMIITTFAGGDEGFADGVGDNARFSLPAGSNATPGGMIALSNDGTFLLLADTKNNRIRKIDIATAEVTTIAGTTGGYSGDGGPAVDAQLFYPTDVAFGPDDAIYIADSKNNVIRKIDTNGIITTVVGTREAGFSPNGTPAKQAKLNQPHGVYVTPDNTLYIADTHNNQVKKVKNP
ncbi:MAG: hypothetical protein AAF985_02485 [Bacteroidota bacterium]